MENTELCFYCESSLEAGDVVKVTRGLKGLVKASELRNDGHSDAFRKLDEDRSSIRLHSECRRLYTHPSEIAKYVNQRDNKDSGPSESKPSLRSSKAPFSMATDCLFCGKEASLEKERKQAYEKRKQIHKVTTLPFRDSVLKMADKRDHGQKTVDEWARVVRTRLSGVSDCPAADTLYHHDCHRAFYAAGDLEQRDDKRGRPVDAEKESAFKNLLKFVEDGYPKCQYSFDELLRIMGAGPKYTRVHLKEKLIKEIGDTIFITEEPGKCGVVNFMGSASTILHDNWYAERKSSKQEEKMRIITTAAELVLRDIRGKFYPLDIYPSPDLNLDDPSILPETLQCFLNVLITTKGTSDVTIARRKNALGQAIVSAARTRSFVSPILLGLGVHMHRHFASRELITMMSKVGFSVDYTEVKRYEYSLMQAKSEEDFETDQKFFHHFAYDNADFNVRSLTGHGTFHSLGGIRFTTPAPKRVSREIKRTMKPPSAGAIAEKGTLPVQWIPKPSKSSLKGVTLQDLHGTGSETATTVKKAVTLDLLCSAGRWSGVPCPSWNGFMRTLYNKEQQQCARTLVEPTPFINLDPGNPSALYTAMASAEKETLKNGQSVCFVTFDCPLFAKANEVVAEAVLGGTLTTVEVRIRGFHLLMSFLGCVGYIMADSGLEVLWEEVYAKNSIPHMMDGHSYARALRAHLLTREALLFSIFECCDEFSSLKVQVQAVITQALEGEASPDEVSMTAAGRAFYQAVADKIDSLKEAGPTARLWIQYLEMIELVLLFIRAERVADWDLHLHCIREMLPYFHAAGHFAYAKHAHFYLQKMEKLHTKMSPDEFQDFLELGYFSIRRDHQFWSCVSPDMAIEQILMRLLKVQGGLTHGRGVSDSQLAYFVMSFPACLNIIEAVERFTGVSAASSEQHVDLRASRRCADEKHAAQFKAWIDTHSPWVQSEFLRSLSTGVVGSDKINCHNAVTIGKESLSSITGQSFADIKLSKKFRVLPLSAMSKSVIIRDEVVPVNSQLLFMRLLWVINSNPGELSKYFKYELAPTPPALFDDAQMRKTAKSKLLGVLPSSPAPQRVPAAAVTVLDGGYLLRALVWPKPTTFGAVVDSYLAFVLRHFSQDAIVVFDGYEDVAQSTKAMEQNRRANKKASYEVAFELNNAVKGNQSDFLANGKNKARLISKLRAKFMEAGIKVFQAKADADTLIAETALEEANGSREVYVVGNDTDLVAILIARAKPRGKRIFLFSPGLKQYDVRECQQFLKEKRHVLLFALAFLGCDTTSAFYLKGKLKGWKLLDDSDVQKLALNFNDKKVAKEKIIDAGEKFAIMLYSSETFDTLDELRVDIYGKKLAGLNVTAKFELASLPPTSAACSQHSMRSYLQVQQWLGNSLDPTMWGWKRGAVGLEPVTTLLPPAPDDLLQLITCGCHGDCTGRCTCRTSGLPCSQLCSHCKGRTCRNQHRTEDVCEDSDDPDDPTALL